MSQSTEYDSYGWLTEWAVEVTWVDPKKAGSKTSTSQYGPFEHPYQRDQFLAQMRRDRDISATRVLTRKAIYTEWEPTADAEPTTRGERDALLLALWQEINEPRTSPERISE